MVEKNADLGQVFERLHEIMMPFRDKLVVQVDSTENYYLETPGSAKDKKPMFFGAVQTKKNQVSYHLMPVYVFPDLLEGMSDKLAKRMQGKSCFNFKNVDDETLEELAELTKRSFERFREAGYLQELPGSD